MESPPSMAAIAKAANVAKSTVSLALRNDPRVSASVREHVQNVARDMGYQANALVARLMFELRSARKQRLLGTLALIDAYNRNKTRQTPKHMDHWLRGAHQQGQKLGYQVDRFCLHEPDVSISRLARILDARNVQGVAIYSVLDEEALQECEPIWSRFPTVVIGARFRTVPLHFVSNDHYATALQAAFELRRRGYSRLCIVLDRWIDTVVEHRFIAAYREDFSRNEKGEPRIYLQDFNEFSTAKGKARFAAWLKKHRPDACICLNIQTLHWIRELGINVPEEMGVAFLDLSDEHKGVAAGMEQLRTEIGMAATDLLVGQILRREIGIPPFQKALFLESRWNPGPTVRELA